MTSNDAIIAAFLSSVQGFFGQLVIPGKALVRSARQRMRALGKYAGTDGPQKIFTFSSQRHLRMTASGRHAAKARQVQVV